MLLSVQVRNVGKEKVWTEFYIAEMDENGELFDQDGEANLPWDFPDFDYWQPIKDPCDLSALDIGASRDVAQEV